MKKRTPWLLISTVLAPLVIMVAVTPTPIKGEQIEKKKVVMIIAQRDFRDEELQKPKSILEKEGIAVTIASSSKEVATGILGATVKPDILITELRVKDYDAIVFIGGPGASQYWGDPTAHGIAQEAVRQGKILAAICIAPVTLANAGVLKGKKATVWPSEADKLTAKGALCAGAPVEVDGNIITASGPEAAEEFGKAIVKGLSAIPHLRFYKDPDELFCLMFPGNWEQDATVPWVRIFDPDKLAGVEVFVIENPQKLDTEGLASRAEQSRKESYPGLEVFERKRINISGHTGELVRYKVTIRGTSYSDTEIFVAPSFNPSLGLNVKLRCPSEVFPKYEDNFNQIIRDFSLTELLFEDDFSASSRRWSEVDRDEYKLWIEEGEYHILMKKAHTVALSWFKEQTYTDFLLEADIRHFSGPEISSFGLAFRLNNQRNFYYFPISGVAKYSLEKMAEGQWVTLKTWTSSHLINKGNLTNHLRVICRGDTIRIYVNNVEVDRIKDPSFAKGHIGLAASSYDEPDTHVVFDNIKVWALPGPTEIIQSSATLAPETTTPFELSKISLVNRLSFISPVGDWMTSMKYPASWYGKPVYPSSPHDWMGLIASADEQMLTHIAVGGQTVSGYTDPQTYLQQKLQTAGGLIRDFKVLNQMDLSEAYSMMLRPMRVQAIAFTYSCLYANTPVLGFTEIGVMTPQESYVLTPLSGVFTHEMQVPANLPPQELYQKVNTLMAIAQSIESTSAYEEGWDPFKSAKGWVDTLGGSVRVKDPETDRIFIVDDKYKYYYYRKGEEWKVVGTNDPWGFQGPEWVGLPTLP